MIDISKLADTPLPTILVVAGILFLMLSVAGSVAGKIAVEPGKQWTAALVGTGLVALGLALAWYGPPQKGPTPAASTSTPAPAPTASPVPPPMPAPAPAPTASPVPPPMPAPAPTAPTLPPVGPSSAVNCYGAPDEIKICASPTLSNLDLQLSDLWWKQLTNSQRSKLHDEQIAWLKKRGQCQSDENCIATVYRSQIQRLKSVLGQ
jgi:type IV secretory pathway VirB10-like protein